MPIFTQGDNSCYFIHIPRTGGRYVSSLFKNSDNVECKYSEIDTERFEGIDSTHLHYPLYNQYLGVESIPHIAIVRNPCKKFGSSIRNMHYMFGVNYNELLLEYSSFNEFVENEINDSSKHNNWFLPQHKFISSKTNIWKYEWGFGKRFKEWVRKKTKINISLNDVSYQRFNNEVDSKFHCYELNNRVKWNIRRYYKKDYKMFRYFL
jgi:hypothetical protein